MDTLLRNLWDAVNAGDLGHSRRRAATRPTLQCDALEDRQLLSFGGGAMPGYAGMGQFRGGPAAYGHHAPSHRGHHHSMMRGGQPGAWGGTMANAPATTPAPFTPPSTPGTPTIPTTPTNTSTTSTTTPAPQTTTPTNPPAPGNPAPQGTLSPNTQAPTGPSAAVKADFQKLQADQLQIQEKSQVTLGQLATLRADFQAIEKAAKSAPSQATITALQTDLKALQGMLPTDAQTTQLAGDFTALVQSRGVTDQSLIAKTVSDAEGIVKASNVTAADLSTIAADQKQIQTDIAASNPSGTQQAPTGVPGGPMGGMEGFASLGGLLGGGFGGPMDGGFGGFGNRGPAGGAQAGTNASSWDGPEGETGEQNGPGGNGSMGGAYGGRMRGAMNWMGGKSVTMGQAPAGSTPGSGGPTGPGRSFGGGWF